MNVIPFHFHSIDRFLSIRKKHTHTIRPLQVAQCEVPGSALTSVDGAGSEPVFGTLELSNSIFGMVFSWFSYGLNLGAYGFLMVFFCFRCRKNLFAHQFHLHVPPSNGAMHCKVSRQRFGFPQRAHRPHHRFQLHLSLCGNIVNSSDWCDS